MKIGNIPTQHHVKRRAAIEGLGGIRLLYPSIRSLLVREKDLETTIDGVSARSVSN
jgi:hypothetical protein